LANRIGPPCRDVGHDRREDRRERWSVLEIGCRMLWILWPRVGQAIRVDPGAPHLALALALAFAQHFHETDFNDDARGSPGKRLLANELGFRCTLAVVSESKATSRAKPSRKFGTYIATFRSSLNSYAFRYSTSRRSRFAKGPAPQRGASTPTKCRAGRAIRSHGVQVLAARHTKTRVHCAGSSPTPRATRVTRDARWDQKSRPGPTT
jgi:hypothetical protein